MTDSPLVTPSRVASLVVRVALGVGLLAGGALGAVVLVKSRPVAAEGAVVETSVPVEVVRVATTDEVVVVRGSGTVVADQQVVLTPQVAGKVVAVDPALRPGGRVRRGDVLVRIDPRDYELAVVQAESQVAQAKLALELERSRADVAVREWELVKSERPSAEAPLALRQPQLASAERAALAAEAALDAARINLERASLRAPFDAIVLSEGVDVGQVVGAATQIATLVGTDRMRVELKVPVEALPHLEIPELGAEAYARGGGSVAHVTQQLAQGSTGGAVEREGRVYGLGGQIDAATRSATVLVAIEDPLGADGGLPLLPGAFVEVAIDGRALPGVIDLPRTGIRDGDVAWVVGPDDRLVRREVAIAWREAERVLISAGLEAGEAVVVSPLALPIEGLAVKLAAGEEG